MEPLSVARATAERILSQVETVKTNHDACQLMARLAEQTLEILRQLEGRLFESSTNAVLELIKDALQEAQAAVDKCCNAGHFMPLLYNDVYASALKQAAKKLEHALSQIPQLSIGMTADIQSIVDALSTQIVNTRFEDEKARTHQIKALKEAIEEAFHQGGQAYVDAKTHSPRLYQEPNLIKEEQRKESLVLRECENETTKNNEGQQRQELIQTIDRVLKTSGDTKEGSRIVANLKDCLRCPISKQIMRDPVLLKDSGMTYDRSSIEEWLRRKHDYDPLTHVKLVSGDLVPIPALHAACQAMSNRLEPQCSIVDKSQERDSQQSLEPGLYEGKGKLVVGSVNAYTSQLLVLEPDGGVVGYTLYKGKDSGDQGNNVEVGVGKWNRDTRELFFRDNCYNYHGSVKVFAIGTQTKLKWSRRLFARDNPLEEFASPLEYSSPLKEFFKKLHPTILQMEDKIDLALSKVTYKSKLVLSLEVDHTIGGWTYFESSTPESRIVGQIVEGIWDSNGRLAFSIRFAPENNLSNYTDLFNVCGTIGYDKIRSHHTFSSIISRVENEGKLQSVKTMPVPLDGLEFWECPSLYEVCNDWHLLLPSPSKLFQVSRSALGMNMNISFSYSMCIEVLILNLRKLSLEKN